MLGSNLLRALLFTCTANFASARSIAARPTDFTIWNDKRAELQDLVTFDNSSIFVRGERVLFFSGEFHPFRLPVPGLWLDVFQKIKALGFNGVSFYVSWALLEGKPGEFRAEGIFNFDDFFAAASDAGIYLLARPGPYINAESSGGGYPGWLARNPGIPRTNDTRYLDATNNYMRNIGEIIAKAQITNGGPVILVQPENEYTSAPKGILFPDDTYFEAVQQQLRDAGIVVPLISNDASPKGNFAPGMPAAVDIYGHDNYPLGFDCANPTNWPVNGLPTNFHRLHEQQSPTTPYSLVEYQGGSFDPWGGSGFDKCRVLLSYEFERVFYKNVFSFGATIFNIYMTFGGTNWGNSGHPGGYTSYDYGAAIGEDRNVAAEKYSELKLEANFLQASTAYLTAISQDNTNANGSFTGDVTLAVTQSLGSPTNFYVIRHANYSSQVRTQYTITVPTSQGNVTVPQLGGELTLSGRDSKFHVTDYSVGGTNLLYSSAEIFTWKQYDDKTVLVLYGGPDELHEFAIQSSAALKPVEGNVSVIHRRNGTVVVQFRTSPYRRILRLGKDFYIYILDRNTAYNFWTVDLPTGLSNNDPNIGIKNAAIVYGAYLVRTASVEGRCFSMTGDFNATTTLEIIGGAPCGLETLKVNGHSVEFEQNEAGVVKTTACYEPANFTVPDLSTVTWKTIDSLPEIQAEYDDSLWTDATLATSNNTYRNLTTPVSLYGQDYGYSYGNLLFRGRFSAHGNESQMYIQTQGGTAFGSSIWLGSAFLGSWNGNDKTSEGNQTVTLPALTSGRDYIVTVLIDNSGLDENYSPGSSQAKSPRGILDYSLSGRSQDSITWKLTGNFGGEDYADRVRGPLNEGGLFIERQGYHLPGAPTDSWATGKPSDGITKAGVQFYSTTFDLDIPAGLDVPLSLSFRNSTTDVGAGGLSRAYRSNIYVNGYQYGKYTHNIGPQDDFPVPQGIWNYNGPNTVGVTLWALESDGAKLDNFTLVAGRVIISGYGAFDNSPQDGWVQRLGAY